MKQNIATTNANESLDTLYLDNIRTYDEHNPRSDRHAEFAKKLRSQYKAFEEGQNATQTINEDCSSFEDELMKKFDELFGGSGK